MTTSNQKDCVQCGGVHALTEECPATIKPGGFARMDPSPNIYRIEALRAASRIAAGTHRTLDMAEQFARWLETGER